MYYIDSNEQLKKKVANTCLGNCIARQQQPRVVHTWGIPHIVSCLQGEAFCKCAHGYCTWYQTGCCHGLKVMTNQWWGVGRASLGLTTKPSLGSNEQLLRHPWVARWWSAYITYMLVSMNCESSLWFCPPLHSSLTGRPVFILGNLHLLQCPSQLL